LYYLNEKIWWIPNMKAALLKELFMTFIHGGPRYGLDDFPMPARNRLLSISLLSIYGYLFLRSIYEMFLKKNRARPHTPADIILLIWFCLPVFFLALVSYAIRPLFVIKHLIFVLPAFLILSAKGIYSIRSPAARFTIASLLVILSIFSAYTIYATDYNVDWRGPAIYLRDHSNRQETIIICSSREAVPFMYYFDYLGRDILRLLDIYGVWNQKKWEEIFVYKGRTFVCIRQFQPLETLNPFGDFVAKYNQNKFGWRDKDIWFAVSRWGSHGTCAKIEALLGRTHTKIYEKTFYGVKLAFWQKNRQ